MTFPEQLGADKARKAKPSIPSLLAVWVRLILEHTGHMARDTGTAWGLYRDRQPGLRDHLLGLL